MWVNGVTVRLGEPVQDPAGFVQGLVRGAPRTVSSGQCSAHGMCRACPAGGAAPLPALASPPVFRPLPSAPLACLFLSRSD